MMMDNLWKKIKGFFGMPQRSQEIDALCLPSVAANLLTCGTKQHKGMGIQTVQQLLQYSKEDLLKVKGMGTWTYWVIQHCLHYKGFIPRPRLPIMDARHSGTPTSQPKWLYGHPIWLSDLRKQDNTLMGRMAEAERCWGIGSHEAMECFRRDEEYYVRPGVKTTNYNYVWAETGEQVKKSWREWAEDGYAMEPNGLIVTSPLRGSSYIPHHKYITRS